MRKKTFVFILFIFSTAFSYGQFCSQPFLGSKTLYQNRLQQYTPAPKGYMPVFINHVGRHGARHLTKDVNSSYIYKLLLKADSLNELTADGKLLKEKMLRLEKIEKKNLKSISEEGKMEQQGIADRMYANNSHVFDAAKPVIHIAYTKEIRTVQTYEAFLKELRTKINEPAVTKELNDTTLRFYDLSPAYTKFKEKGSWLQDLEHLKNTLHINELDKAIDRRFFTPAFFGRLTSNELDNFTSDLFGFITIIYSLQKEIADAGYNATDLDMQMYVTCPQLRTLATFDNAEDYLAKGPGSDINGIQVKIAAPLLADFITTTDGFITTKTIQAQLRFSHAETIAPFAALLGLSNAATPAKRSSDIEKVWNAANVIPLSANIQWILYKKNNNNDYLVKFLLNEKEAAVKGLYTTTFPYYKWSNVRIFYIKKLAALGAGLNTDFIKYLSGLL